MDRLNEEMAFQLTSLKSVSDAEVPTDIAIDQLASMFADLPEDFQENFVRHVGDSSTYPQKMALIESLWLTSVSRCS